MPYVYGQTLALTLNVHLLRDDVFYASKVGYTYRQYCRLRELDALGVPTLLGDDLLPLNRSMWN